MTRPASPGDLVLRWCSEQVTGSLRDFHSACHAAGLPAPRARALLRELQVLGHLEVDWERMRWGVAPAVLVVLPEGGGHAVLCGARPALLERRLREMHEDPDDAVQTAGQHLFLAEETPHDWAPRSLYFCVADNGDGLERGLGRLGVHLQRHGAEALALLGPGLDTEEGPGQRRSVVPGEDCERLVRTPRGRTWSDSASDDAEGSYRYTRHGRRVYAVRRADAWYECEPAWCWWWAEHLERGPTSLRLFPGSRRLEVRADLPLPLLLARSAVLASGQLPQDHEDGLPGRRTCWTGYRNVGYRNAMSIGARLLVEPVTC